MKDKIRQWLLEDAKGVDAAEDIGLFVVGTDGPGVFSRIQSSLQRLHDLLSDEEIDAISAEADQLLEQVKGDLAAAESGGGDIDEFMDQTNDSNVIRLVAENLALNSMLAEDDEKLEPGDAEQFADCIEMAKQFIWFRQAVRSLLEFTDRDSSDRDASRFVVEFSEKTALPRTFMAK